MDLRRLNCSCQILVAYNLLGVCKQLQFSSLLKKEETMVFLMFWLDVLQYFLFSLLGHISLKVQYHLNFPDFPQVAEHMNFFLRQVHW